MNKDKDAKLKEILKNIGLGSKEEAIAQAISDLSDESKLEFFTWIFPFEDDSLSLMQTIGDRYNLKWLKDLIRMKLRLRTSLNGWRANQIVEVASETRKQKQLNWFARHILRREEKKGREVEEFE